VDTKIAGRQGLLEKALKWDPHRLWRGD
jgi:hypothetical protein